MPGLNQLTCNSSDQISRSNDCAIAIKGHSKCKKIDFSYAGGKGKYLARKFVTSFCLSF